MGGGGSPVHFDGDHNNNTVHLITTAGAESWPAMAKTEVAAALAARISEHMANLPEVAE